MENLFKIGDNFEFRGVFGIRTAEVLNIFEPSNIVRLQVHATKNLMGFTTRFTFGKLNRLISDGLYTLKYNQPENFDDQDINFGESDIYDDTLKLTNQALNHFVASFEMNLEHTNLGVSCRGLYGYKEAMHDINKLQREVNELVKEARSKLNAINKGAI